MKPEIKQRIEQIKAGQVPGGYKKTKIGVVPKEWEEVRFKKMFSRLSRKNCENNDNVLTISAQYGLISQSEFFNKNIASEDKSNYFLLHKGEYAYNKSYSNGYPYGALKKLERYEKGIVSPLYICFSPTSDNKCAEYYSHYFESNLIGKEIKAIAQEGARNHGLLNISVNDFFNMYILNPPLAEQEKIVKILSTQDRIIELYQRKIEELQKMKKIYLSKMFPKKGENAPEWRFPQFTTPWEQRKLGEIGKARSGIGFPDSEQGGKEGIPFYKVSDMNLDGNEIEMTVANNYVSTEQIARKKWSPLEDVPAIYFAKVGAAVMLNRKRLCRKPFLFDNNTMAYSLNIKYWNTEFAKAEFSKIDLTRLVQVGALPSYNANDVDAISIVLPSLEEQQKIGAYFANLDNLITFHQRKLEETKKYKKALMQLLLTGIVRCE